MRRWSRCRSILKGCTCTHCRIMSRSLRHYLPRPEAARPGLTLSALNHRPLFWFKRERNPGFFDYTRRIFDRAGYAPTYVEEPAEHDVLLARIARGEGMILLPASFSAIQRQGVAFCPVAEGDAMPLSLGVIYPPHQAESVQQWLSLLDGILATG